MTYSSVQGCIDYLRLTHDVLIEIKCNYENLELAKLDLYSTLKKQHRDAFNENQRLVFIIDQDFYNESLCVGGILHTLQTIIQDIDISNFFVCIVTTNPEIDLEYEYIKNNVSWDPVPIHIYKCHGNFTKIKNLSNVISDKFQSLKQLTPTLDQLTEKQKKLLFVDRAFCIMPWVGINVEPNSQVRPCCAFTGSIGDASKQNITEILNSTTIKEVRKSMLNGIQPTQCSNCYMKEKFKRDSLRNSINRDFAHCAEIIDQTQNDGFLDTISIKYWDLRYNNLCNFACRSCNPQSSTSWYQIHNSLNPESKLQMPLLQAGQDQDLLFDFFCKNVDQVEKIYFAGGEPTIIENFYKVLEILDERGKHDIHLVYNINLSRLNLGNRSILDLWSRFKKITVGASLDAYGARAEYLRVGTVWNDILKNQSELINKCPHVDFFVSATTGLINALHVPEFHRSWVEQGLIEIDDFNIQLLTEPAYLGIVNAPNILKQKILDTYTKHIEWVTPRDKTGRATAGFKSIIDLCQTSGIYDAENFWKNIDNLDRYHKTDLMTVFPELIDMGLYRI